MQHAHTGKDGGVKGHALGDCNEKRSRTCVIAQYHLSAAAEALVRSPVRERRRRRSFPGAQGGREPERPPTLQL